MSQTPEWKIRHKAYDQMPEEFRHTIQDQIRPALLLMQSITRFTLQSGSKNKVPFVHAPDFMLKKGIGDNLE